jgi:hypothetical protein
MPEKKAKSPLERMPTRKLVAGIKRDLRKIAHAVRPNTPQKIDKRTTS